MLAYGGLVRLCLVRLEGIVYSKKASKKGGGQKRPVEFVNFCARVSFDIRRVIHIQGFFSSFLSFLRIEAFYMKSLDV